MKTSSRPQRKFHRKKRHKALLAQVPSGAPGLRRGFPIRSFRVNLPWQRRHLCRRGSAIVTRRQAGRCAQAFALVCLLLTHVKSFGSFVESGGLVVMEAE